jgi:peptide/nickel transport system substrate-binding protein
MILAGCRSGADIDIPITLVPPTPTAEVVLTPTPVPPPPETLIVCLNQEPESLFLYSDEAMYGPAAAEAQTVFQAIYDGPVDYLDDRLAPVILAALPSFENGSVSLEAVQVAESDVYLNPVTMQAENFRLGSPYMPQGCRGPECIKQYSGGEAAMERMTVEFELQPGWRWSDGEPLKASDSVFSYQLDSSSELNTTKYLVDRTQSYEALDEHKVRWSSIPGYLDPEFATLFWLPLPEHLLGDVSAAGLPDAELSARTPLGWGAYQLDAWVEGERITLSPNPYYKRADEGLPRFDRLIFRFIGADSRTGVQQLLTGECDVLDESVLDALDAPLLESYLAEGSLDLNWAAEPELGMLIFNNAPLGRQGEAYFQAPAARQAVAACLNRQQLVEDLFGVYGSLPETWPPDALTGASPGTTSPAYDPQAGRDLLRGIGWVENETEPGQPRVAWGVPGVASGSELVVTYLSSGTPLDEAIAARLIQDLGQCGFGVHVQSVSSEAWVEPWPQGAVFGRGFDLTHSRWPLWITPVCEMLAGREVPGAEHPFGVNASGFSDQAYSQACDRLLLAGFDAQIRTAAITAMQQSFALNQPVLALYQPPRWVAFQPGLCGVELHALSESALWNIEVWSRGGNCP